ncbi:unnamed protein product [Adineta steineri]|uniref:Chitin-binding type-2 domain-containing protein n=1 Tax=Adineta steineri TaxID=433720 RepID=A0A819LE75_9BILA|nr:unnamed protein product [Adineta steineri]
MLIQSLSLLIVLLIIYETSSSFVNRTTSAPIHNATTVVKKLGKYALGERSSGVQYMSEIGSRCTGKLFIDSRFLFNPQVLDDGFFPDKNDCRKFHVCYGGIQSIRRCKEGMLWDETKIGCNMQNITICTGGRQKWKQDDDPTEMISKSVRANYTCRAGANGLFADPSSCSFYHWCVQGVLHSSHYCNLGLHFSASASGCVLPIDAECEGQIAPPYSSIECALDRSGYFPDPYDCSVFHYCDGVRIQSEALLCSAGRVWSSRLENCAWPHEVPECINACPPNYSSQMRFADPAICSQYIQCVDGSLQQRTCSNNFLFDRITKTCKPYDQAECHGDKSELPVTQTNNFYAFSDGFDNNPMPSEGPIKKQRTNQFNCFVDGYFGDAQDCRIYHVCVDGRDYRSVCAPGLHWESLLRLCLPAHLVSCQNSKSIDSSSGSKQNWLQLFTRSVIKTTTTTSQTTPLSLPSIFTCAGRINGYYSDPIHCHKFHYCGTGWHSVMECDKGLAYSVREHDCIPIELTNCNINKTKNK